MIRWGKNGMASVFTILSSFFSKSMAASHLPALIHRLAYLIGRANRAFPPKSDRIAIPPFVLFLPHFFSFPRSAHCRGVTSK